MTTLSGASVVITGASSGIGRAAALAFADLGARVVLAARRADVLEEVARDCERRGGQAVAVETDVTDPEAVEALAQAAMEAFGGIDIWVNNAGVGAIGAYQDVPLAMHRQVVEVNLMGAMHGAHAVLPIFLRQRRGTIINTVSIGAWAPTPFAAAYTASKFGLRGFAASLRQELEDFQDIHVCGVFPAVVDTPGLTHGANLSGRRINPGAYLYAPETVADAIVGVALQPRDEVPVGWPSRAAQRSYGLAPKVTEHLIGRVVRGALSRADVGPMIEGAVMRTVPDGTLPSGGWRQQKGVPDAHRINKIALTAAGAAVCLGALAWASSRRPR
ncbi:Short-chain dehydrogenase [Palleronia marisminoris]|uniref:Putative oxidoreductase n=1 Tax=Palleronia marisminoris TaxID=315423 RepID=A0A1Y5R8Z7_9RHOB|nr:SDR family oxidoreductase [Palleronia marisminoris]SFG06687.1 Short-chain dehydrogenase [Palleronia marisminoris]SLN10806.1 putative oxidoreductase [Palleronia marisminoris]